MIFIFESVGVGRDMIFRGLAVPGTNQLGPREDLIAIWKSFGGQRFQNYKAMFTILDCGAISGDWVRSVFTTRQIDLNDVRAPQAFKEWVKSGKIRPLMSEPIKTRSPEDQQPLPGLQTFIIEQIREAFAQDPYAFEPIAAQIWRMSSPTPMEFEMTKRYRDGGRDAIGHLLVGPKSDAIKVHFALEAKLYGKTTRVGVKETSRLISRLKHREFGVLVTTSVLDRQAYEEIRSDMHPIIVISGRDIAEILISQGINTPELTKKWLESLS